MSRYITSKHAAKILRGIEAISKEDAKMIAWLEKQSSSMDWLDDKTLEPDICMKCRWDCLHVYSEDSREFILCAYCGYLCEVQDNRYTYHIILPEYAGDLKYDIDSRGQVIIHHSQQLDRST